MKYLLLALAVITGQLSALPELDAAIAAKDQGKAIELYATRALNETELEQLLQFIAGEKEKYRKKLSYAIRDRKATDAVSGKHLHNELLRLIKDNLVEDDTDYTEALLLAAGVNKNPDLIYSIAPFLVHPRLELRKEANRSVALKKDERIYPLIGQLLAGENVIDKVYAMETLLALKDERAVPLLLLQLSNQSKNVRYFALKTLEAIGSDKAQYGVINLAQGDPDEEVRLKAVEILRQFKTGPVFFALQKLIGDSQLIVRTRALESALAQLDKKYANAISEQLARETDMTQKHALLRGLLTLGSGGGMNGILTLLKKESDAELLLWAAFACNRFSDSRCADLFAQLLGTRSEQAIVLEAVLGLAHHKQRKHLAVLFTLAQDAAKPQPLRSAALSAIQQYDNEAAIAPLFLLYESEQDQLIRVQARTLMTELMKKKLPRL
ncbi:MAG: HEAT repeat domain-containing protein [Spirochaetota bacterium]